MWRAIALVLVLAADVAQAAPFAYIANAASNNVSVIDTATNTVSAIIPVGLNPTGVAVNPVANRVYISNYDSNTVSVIDPVANLVVANIPVGTNPLGLALNPAGTRLYVTNNFSNNVSVVDTAANLVIATIPTRGFGIAVNPAGTRAYMTSGDCTASSSSGGACIGRVSAIDTASNVVIANLSITGAATGIVVNSAGTRAYAVATDQNGGRMHVIDTGSNTLVTTTNMPATSVDGPWSLAINPSGTRVYVTDWTTQNVLVVDTASNIVIATVGLGNGTYPYGISVTPGGDRAYVTRRDANDVVAIDLATNTTLATIRVGSSPRSFGNFIGTPPAAPTTLSPSASISTGGFHTCGLDSTGKVYCWGDNSAGELGDGSTTNRSVPVQAATGIARISAGRQDHTCAIATDGGVKCWGNNAYGQLGDGTTVTRTSAVAGPGTATAIAGGGFHTCKIGGDTALKCWGNNSSGQLGNGTTSDSATAVNVTGLTSGVTAIAAGFSHNCALTSAGSVMCWGDNRYGQVGDGSSTNRSTPVAVAGLSSGVTAIALGAYHSCALLSSGAIRCWGKNESGQVGDGTTSDRATPTSVVGVGGGASAIAGGGFHTCAVFTGGAASCWGQNVLGQLGDGTVVNRTSPVSVTGLGQGVSGIKAGGFHTCVRVTDGGVRCWGSSSVGQLGDGGLSAHPIQRYVVGAGGNGYLDLTPEDPVSGPPPAVQAFAITVTGSITATTANVSANVQFRTQDVGKQYFIYFLAPASVAKSFEASSPRTSLEPALTPKDGPQCVLARLTSNGLQRVDATALTAAGNVTTSAGQAVSILNNVPTSQVAGATACIGTGTSGTQATTAGNNQCAVTIQGTETCVSNDDTALGPAATTPGGLSGLWYNASESGWGINFTQRRNIVFAAWYTYDSAGAPKWYVASSCAMTSTTATGGTCSGTLYEVSGPTFFSGAFNPSAANVRSAGTMSVDFQNTNSGSLTYNANGLTRTVSIARQPITSGTTAPAIDYTDLWWNPSESGWGMAITHQFSVMFLAWYVYDNSGRPVWYVASSCAVSGNGCSGTLYRTTGPPLGPTFNPSQVQVFMAGTVSLNFTNANNGTLTYTVNGVTSSKTITRQLF